MTKIMVEIEVFDDPEYCTSGYYRKNEDIEDIENYAYSCDHPNMGFDEYRSYKENLREILKRSEKSIAQFYKKHGDKKKCKFSQSNYPETEVGCILFNEKIELVVLRNSKYFTAFAVKKCDQCKAAYQEAKK